MRCGNGVSESAGKAALELVQSALGQEASVHLVLKAGLASKKALDLLVVSDHHIVNVSTKEPSCPPVVWDLQEVEGLAEIKSTGIYLRKWDGSRVNVGYLLHRRKDEELLEPLLRHIISSQPEYEENRLKIASREVRGIGYKFPDESGRSVARRLDSFLQSGEVVLFVSRFIGSSGIKADSIALTDQHILLFDLEAFGEAPTAAMSYRNVAHFSLKKSKLSIADQVGNHVELGRLRYDSQDGSVVDQVLGERIPSSLTSRTSTNDPDSDRTVPESPSLETATDTKCDIWLESGGSKLIPVIKACREHAGLGLREAKKLVESAPTIILRDISIGRGTAIKRELEDLGASVTLHILEVEPTSGVDVMDEQLGSPAVAEPVEIPERSSLSAPGDNHQAVRPRFCSRCGESVASKEHRFCHGCGEPLDESSTNAPQVRNHSTVTDQTIGTVESSGSDALSLGEVCYERGDLIGAKAHFESAAADGSLVAMFNLGVVSNELGNSSEARSWYLKAADLGDVEAKFNLAVLLSDSGEVAEAVRWYEEAAGSGHISAAYNLGVHFDQNVGNTEAAALWFERAARDGDADALFMLASILKEQGDMEGAKARYRRASEAGKVEATQNLGLILLQEGSQESAVETLLLAAEQGSTSAMTVLGTNFRERGDLDAAQVWLTKAAEAGDADGMYELAQLLLQVGPDDGGWMRRASDAGHLQARVFVAAVNPNTGSGRRTIRD